MDNNTWHDNTSLVLGRKPEHETWCFLGWSGCRKRWLAAPVCGCGCAHSDVFWLLLCVLRRVVVHVRSSMRLLNPRLQIAVWRGEWMFPYIYIYIYIYIVYLSVCRLCVGNKITHSFNMTNSELLCLPSRCIHWIQNRPKSMSAIVRPVSSDRDQWSPEIKARFLDPAHKRSEGHIIFILAPMN